VSSKVTSDVADSRCWEKEHASSDEGTEQEGIDGNKVWGADFRPSSEF